MVFPVDFRNATSEDFCTSQRAFLPRDRMQIDSFFRKLRNEELERVNKKKGIDTNQGKQAFSQRQRKNSVFA